MQLPPQRLSDEELRELKDRIDCERWFLGMRSSARKNNSTRVLMKQIDKTVNRYVGACTDRETAELVRDGFNALPGLIDELLELREEN
jgi:hypothetical protein